MYLGKRLKLIRQKLNLSQTEFANALDVSQAYYSGLESSKKKTSIKLLDKIYQKWPESRDILNKSFKENEGVEVRGKIGGANEGNITFEDLLDQLQAVQSSKEYRQAQGIEKQIIMKYNDEFRALISVLSTYRELQLRLLQFVHQYDKYMLAGIVFELLEQIKANKSEEQIMSEVKKVLSNVQNVFPIFEKFNQETSKVIDQLRMYDSGNELDKRRWSEMKEFIKKQEYHKAAPLKSIFDLLEKSYPIIDEPQRSK